MVSGFRLDWHGFFYLQGRMSCILLFGKCLPVQESKAYHFFHQIYTFSQNSGSVKMAAKENVRILL